MSDIVIGPQMPSIEIRVATYGEMIRYGIEGTDTAAIVRVDGQVVGYTDDYGTGYPIEGRIKKDALEALSNAAIEIWSPSPEPEYTRMSAKPPWGCPHCGAKPNERCRSVRPPHAKFSQMHIQRWNSRP